MAHFIFFLLLIFEIVATGGLKESEGFTKLFPSVVAIVGYVITFYFFSLALKELPIGIAYAVWGGVGILILTLIGYFKYNQQLDTPALLGILLITAGVLIINLFSKTVTQ